MSCVPPPPSWYRPRMWVLLALLLALHAAAASPLLQTEAAIQPIRIGPIRPLRVLPTAADSATKDAAAAVGSFEPVVSVRSVILRNNITISQSRLVLSRLDQLFLLQRLLDLVDLAPKLASKMEAVGAALPDEDATAQGFLFAIDGLKTLDRDAAVAIVDVAGTKLGFGWRYPLAYWTQLGARQKPKCALGVVAGRFFYC